MMNRSVRGMAKVSIVWTIVILVAFLLALLLFFLGQGELEKQVSEVATLQRRVTELEATNKKNSEEFVLLSQATGFVDEAKGSRADAVRVQNTLKSLQESYPDIDSTIKTIEGALPIMTSAYTAQKQRVADLESQVAAKDAEIKTQLQNINEIQDQSSKDIGDLRRQVADAEQQKNDLQSGLEKQLAESRAKIQELGQQVQGLITANADTGRKFTQEAEALRGRLSEASRKLTPFVKEPNSADGQVLSISNELGLGWINLGAKNRLPLGTRFTVVSGKSGSERVKAMAEVTQVDADMAEVKFTEQTDPFDPPVPGDVVYNPLYDPRGERHAILVGGFSEEPKKGIEALLVSMGVKVQNKLDKSVDFMIVGSEQYVDENNQAVDTPVQPADLQVYKEGVAQGVQVVLLKDLRNYFRY